MLSSIHIENYALIQQTDIHFENGFVAITGETGAGKSIILGALGLLTGSRADVAILGDKERKCVVEAVFDITGQGLQQLLESQDLDYDDHLSIRREILPTGKSRAFVGDTPVGLPVLKTLGEQLVDIHSQHQTLAITNALYQIQLLDELCSFDMSTRYLLADYQQAYGSYTNLKHRLEELTAEEAKNRKEEDYYRFLYNELQEAKLQDNEQQDLEDEANMLAHTEQLKETFGTLSALCDAEEDGALQRLIKARSALSHITAYHKELPDLDARLQSATIELQDIVSSIDTINSHMEFSPERQQQVTERLDLIYRLQKKHAVSDIASLLQIQSDLKNKLDNIGTIAEEIAQVMEQVDQAFNALQQAADKLTAGRGKTARRLEADIRPILAHVGMAEAVLSVEIKPANSYSDNGHDEIVFLFNANRGGELRPISKVASGGELSRLMLAIKAIKANMQRSELHSAMGRTLIFDEIDTGVSGDISIAVGNIMNGMTASNQVIAITHLPQIAAKAAQHFKVSKAVNADEDRTISRMHLLEHDERVHEIAVMLSSNPPSSAALQTASELLQKSC